MDTLPTNNRRPPSQELKEVVLRVLLEVLSKYQRGAAELNAEFEISGITAELLMHVCLAAPEVDDLILGFIRDDLRVVSLSEQTRSMVERDLRLLERDSSRWMSARGGSLGRQLSVKEQAEADARIAQGKSSELEQFILQNPGVHDAVRGLKHSDLMRWVMLSLMRETKARERGSGVTAAWLATLGPEVRDRVRAIQSQYRASRTSAAEALGGREERRFRPRIAP